MVTILLEHLDVVALRRWVVTARADLATHAAALDRLNVYPVPDGDTGTNLLLTMDQALHTLAEEAPRDLAPAARVLARATLVAARGNSGVILSQLVAGVAQVVAELGGDFLDGRGLAAVLRRAGELATRGVGTPVAGTMLTVAEAAADGAETAAERDDRLAGVVDAAVAAASDALLATPGQLEALRRAGVVDAGGAGYLIVIEALQRVVHGVAGSGTDPRPQWLRISESGLGARSAEDSADESDPAVGPAYEVMYLLDHTDGDRVEALRAALSGLGDSTVIGGGPDLYSVHVHIDDVAAALNAGEQAGHPHRFAVTRFADDLHGVHHQEVTPGRTCTVVLADGVGLVDVVRAEGALVPDSAVGGLASVTDYLALVEKSGARSVVLLAASREAAQTALEVARLLERAGRQVAVPRCHHPSQVLAALATCAADASLPARVETIRRAVQGVRTGLVEWPESGDVHSGSTSGRTFDGATRDGDGVARVAALVLQDLLREDSELVTLVGGAGLPREVLEQVVSQLDSAASGLEITVIVDGGIGMAVSIGVE